MKEWVSTFGPLLCILMNFLYSLEKVRKVSLPASLLSMFLLRISLSVLWFPDQFILPSSLRIFLLSTCVTAPKSSERMSL